MQNHERFVAFDVETTGLHPENGHRIVEIGLIRYQDGTIIECFETLINPCRPIPPDARAIHGIRDEDVQHAPLFSDIIEDILTFIGHDPLVAHNAPFDMKFLRYEIQRALTPGIQLQNPTICTMRLACWLELTRRWPRLESLISLLGIHASPAHRALADAEAAGYAFLKMWSNIRPMNISLHELPEMMKRFRTIREIQLQITPLQYDAF